MSRETVMEAEWTPRQKSLAHETLSKYTAQLTLLGIDFDQIAKPAAVIETVAPAVRQIVQSANRRVVLLKSGIYHLSAPYDKALVDDIKLLPNRVRAWVPERKVWEVNFSKGVDGKSLAEFNSFLDKWKFQLSPEAKADVQVQFAAAIVQEKEREEAFKASFATDADITIPGLGGKLRGFQLGGVKYAVEKKRCFIADEMGLGKTPQALAVLQHANAFPAVIVCRAALRQNWIKETRVWLPERRATLDPADMEYRIMQVLIISYEGLVRWYDKLEEYDWQGIVVDESQYIKSNKAQRTKACKDLAKVSKAPIRLCLTGTPIDNAPYEFAPQLTFLDQMKAIGGSEYFYDHFCGNDTRGAQNLPELNALLRKTCYIRRLKKDVLKELPAKQRSFVPLEIDNMKEYKQAESDIRAFLRGLREVKESDVELVSQDEDEAQQKKNSSAADALVKISYLKQIAMKGMLEAAKAWIEDFLESGEKLVVFCHHIEAQRQVWQMFRDIGVWTGNSAGAQAAVDAFQKDDKIKLIVCSLQRDNAGHTLTAASNVVFLELGWTPTIHNQAEDRCHRIGQHDNVTAWYLIAVGTIYEKIIALINKKREIVEAATDATRTQPQTANILRDLIRQLAA